jgi:hypothetical protein
MLPTCAWSLGLVLHLPKSCCGLYRRLYLLVWRSLLENELVLQVNLLNSGLCLLFRARPSQDVSIASIYACSLDIALRLLELRCEGCSCL